MKKHIHSTLILLISAVVFTVGCDKQEIYNESKATLNPAIAQYFINLKEGSFWVYKTNTGNTETVSVKQYRDKDPNLAILMHSSLGNEFILNASFNEFFVQYYYPTQTGNNHYVLAEAKTNSIVTKAGAYSVKIEKISMMEVNGKTYTDVLKTTDAFDANFSEYYFAPEIGIIKKVSADGNTIYELTENEISK